MDILIRVNESDGYDSYYVIPDTQPHPLAVPRTFEKVESSGKTETWKLVAKLDESGKPYIGKETSWQYPKGWFENGRDHREVGTAILRTVDVQIWVVSVYTLDDLDRLMDDLEGTLSQEREFGTDYTLEAYTTKV